MRTTVDLPEVLFSLAQATAKERGIPLEQLLSEAIAKTLQPGQPAAGKPWMAFAGQLRNLRPETARINALIEQEFENVEPEDSA